jgi:hypothetical protein
VTLKSVQTVYRAAGGWLLLPRSAGVFAFVVTYHKQDLMSLALEAC